MHGKHKVMIWVRSLQIIPVCLEYIYILAAGSTVYYYGHLYSRRTHLRNRAFIFVFKLGIGHRTVPYFIAEIYKQIFLMFLYDRDHIRARPPVCERLYSRGIPRTGLVMQLDHWYHFPVYA